MEGNYSIYRYQKDRRSEREILFVGVHLDRQSSIHMASPISSICVIPHDNNRYNILTTSEGEVGIIMPISGEDYMVLLSLQKCIIDTLPQIAALNPDNFRYMFKITFICVGSIM